MITELILGYSNEQNAVPLFHISMHILDAHSL